MFALAIGKDSSQPREAVSVSSQRHGRVGERKGLSGDLQFGYKVMQRIQKFSHALRRAVELN